MTTLSAADLELAHGVRMAVTRLARRLRNQRSDLSLTPSQLSALAALDKHGPITPGQLADHEKVQPPSMTRVLGVLEEKGLVVSTPHPTDGRQKVVEVTSAAHAMLVADRRAREEWLASRMAELSSAEVAALRAATPVLEKLIAP
ncbi:MarR family winged helix-turn-helix transcriptional regulator [Sporichthya polymorpha]|uniref:MarR family winged helix-turn-helix transcriptional regulator n=1 Tax=Sporichthya polymorpha TaxID=35751 RepID=UPI00036E47C4|nr:MarR family transcriptional regulator [Sporichthya polymorpha]